MFKKLKEKKQKNEVKKAIIASLQSAINDLELERISKSKEIERLSDRSRILANNNMKLINENLKLQDKVQDLENNIDILYNNLTPTKKKLIPR